MRIATIVMAHADTDFRKKLLKECLSAIKTPIILSINFPVDPDIQLLCDHVIYTKDNPIVRKEEYNELGIVYNSWYKNDKGDKIYTLMEYEHGFAAYCLIRNGVEYAESKGFDSVHCINYDYQINEATLKLHEKHLKGNNLVAYVYDGAEDYDDFGKDRYSTGFFSAKITALKTFLVRFNTKQDYYFYDGFSILERKMYDHFNTVRPGFLVKELSNESLKKENKVNQEGVLMFSKSEKRMRIMFLAPHLSTGGMPAFLLKRIEVLKDSADIFVVEYECLSLDYVVQRNAIKELVGDNFATLVNDKMALFHHINKFKPDIIHIDEMSERFDNNMIRQLYNKNRSYKIVETCHDVAFNPDVEKMNNPDAYAFCTPYHIDTFNKMNSPKSVIEFPIDYKYLASFSIEKLNAKIELGMDVTKKHVLNVGLWTPGKNQKEGLEIAKKYPNMHFHFVGNQAGNFRDYWKPLMKNVPNNVTIWGERSDIDTFMMAADIFMFNSTWECNPLVLREAIGYGLPIVARNLPQYKDMFTDYINPINTDLNDVAPHRIPTNNTSTHFKENHMSLYGKMMVSPKVSTSVTIIQHFIEHPFLEIKGNNDAVYDVKFYDEEGVLHYEQSIKSNSWVKLNRSWYTRWTAEVWNKDVLVYQNVLDYTGKRVYIAIDSGSLGDTIAWLPYCLDFQKKHDCHVVVSTFKNFLFEKVYPELEFVKPGKPVEDLHGMYRLGWFYNSDSEPVLPNTVPLQQTATNILGLEYKEILPRIDFTPKDRPYDDDYVAIATNSTAGCKFWQKEEWVKLVAYLKSKGYKVINVSQEKNDIEGVEQITDTSMQNTMNIIYHSDFIIGLSSGLSWLAWAMNKHVVMISNFTEANHEFQTNCTRITNTSVCHGCWNEKDTIFDKGDWNWCKHHEYTPRMWECQKSITSDFVIQQIKKLL